MVKLVQPNLIEPTTNGLVGLWANGVDATRAHMTYATYAVDSGLPLDGFIQVAKEQHAFMRHLMGEYDVVNSKRSSYPDADQLAFIRMGHDYIYRLWTYLNANLDTCDRRPKHKTRMHKTSRAIFHLNPPLSEFVRGIGSFVYARYPDRAVEPLFFLTNELHFRDDRTAAHARGVIENLIENAIKYNVHGGMYAVEIRGSKILVYDKGIGMDPAFAAQLGEGKQIRELRAKGVEGTGTGWESIAKHCQKMGWRWEIETQPGKGTKVTIVMNDEDFIKLDRTRPLEIRTDFQPLPLAEIVQGAERYTDLKPFAGYRLGAGPDSSQIDITQSPIFDAIEHANALMNHLVPE